MIEEAVGRYQTSLPSSVIAFVQHGGAISRVKPDATAFSHRDAKHSVLVVGSWDDKADADPNMQWVRGVWSKVEPMTDGFYVNEMSQEDPRASSACELWRQLRPAGAAEGSIRSDEPVPAQRQCATKA